jgi:predicted TIM-barrel fold metal-dependent hydrolase
MPYNRILLALVLLAAPALCAGEPLDGRDGRDLSLSNFRPKAMLKTAQTPIGRAKFPVVDVHTHFRIRTHSSPEALEEFVRVMDRNNIALCVSLDGGIGDKLDEHAKYLEKHKDRFVMFANLDWQGEGKADEPATWDCNRPDFGRRMALALADAKKRGACGLKIFKQFGLGYQNADGSLIKIDDERWDPIWKACGDEGLPVLIHVADPAAFFLPIDETNERWEELHRHPDWSFYGDKFPKREELLAAFLRVVKRHPKTIFIGAHVCNNPEDLVETSKWLDEYPNLYTEFASRISELGRQPYSARKFLIKYQDRVLFGTDGPWPETRVRLYWRFLETFDENFPYSEKDPPPQGLWNIHGIGLPDEVLKKLYHENAAKLLPAVKQKLGQ